VSFFYFKKGKNLLIFDIPAAVSFFLTLTAGLSGFIFE